MATIQQTAQYIRENIQTVYPEPEAGAIAQLVLEHVLHKSQVQLSLGQQEEITPAQEAQVQQAVGRLRRQEPVQYVLGMAHFYGLDLQVDERVLIPRPETEELVDLVVREHKGQQNLSVMDICAGSGCIPLALAANLQVDKVYGLELSEGALQVARANAERYSLPVEWLQQDVFDPIEGIAPHSLDIVTSNPPYVMEQEKALMRPNVLAYEPHLALFVPDSEPLKYYKRIAELGAGLLKKGGQLYFEINEQYGEEVRQLLLQYGFAEAEVVQDLFNKNRIVKAVL
ncbi:peptide chain release factor N(5)-glutamine methyltransferase [Pontibacter sp. JH31]|uniref:Release factor glutamine methyltransferase n=1 Tax=Pontibacter aquaedesilientis TaxID=2766980 RepID=A0ABR7XL62_9BACT|nr:peptide chain release factor N(5)-glutamine methyltransferase [Pontibacter aquaedesilientis]MBD1398997.1 peptide chain release factor N(5)-glutamine methyltransferase [Pontibacter aquaedesilientis]